MKLAFVTDSGTGQTEEFWKKKGIYSLPLQITVDGKTYDEGVNIFYKDVIEALHDEKQLKTSMPSLGKIEDLFEELKKDGYTGVFCVPICKGLSGTFDAMESAAHQVGLDFYGFDCSSTAVLEAHCILRAKTMYDEGASIEEIMEHLEKIALHSDTILICDDLQHMKRGGRLTASAAMLGGLLKIKPILHLDPATKGKVDVLDKVRTMSRAQDRVIDRMRSIGVAKGYDITVAHVDSLPAVQEFAKKIAAAFPECSVRIIDLVSAVSAHTGLNCLAVQVFDMDGQPVATYTEENSIPVQQAA